MNAVPPRRFEEVEGVTLPRPAIPWHHAVMGAEQLNDRDRLQWLIPVIDNAPGNIQAALRIQALNAALSGGKRGIEALDTAIATLSSRQQFVQRVPAEASVIDGDPDAP